MTADLEAASVHHGRSVSTFGQAAPRAARDAAYVLLALFAVASAVLVFRAGFRDDTIGFDLRGTLWEPALAIRDGLSPFPPPTTNAVEVGNPALYPPFLMFLVAPLTFLPWWLGLSIWIVVQAAAIVFSLWVLRVRDVRCYALALLSLPVVRGLAWGNATLLLVPLVALAWRWRALWTRVGVIVGVAIAAKLFLWPLVFWLVGSRRYRAVGTAVATAVAVVLLPWALIGFEGLADYPELLRAAERVYATHSFSVATILAGVGVEVGIAGWGALAVGGLLAVAALIVGRRGCDDASFSFALLAAILGSPILWEYYYAILIVPLAIVRPRFSWPWMLLPLFYVTHRLPRPLLLETELNPGGSACCRPDDAPFASWVFNHAPPGMWPALGHALLAVLITAAIMWGSRRSARRSEACR
jgi:hypothetical protein